MATKIGKAKLGEKVKQPEPKKDEPKEKGEKADKE
jgi:hypothetical protein